jgi:pyruvate,orthophosphate dikinase
MILARDADEEGAALEELGRVQQADFEEILRSMDGLPVTVRLLDPPLHEFLPSVAELTLKEATEGLSEVEQRELSAARTWAEHNPMIGTRGVRLGVLKPGLYAMQVRALLAAVQTLRDEGLHPIVEVMIPLTVTRPELALARSWVEAEIQATDSDHSEITIGTMIETPRAALRAGDIAHDADFFSFGTNDLTQLTFGFSRDDVESRMMPAYLDLGLLSANPFDTIDEFGVGELLRVAVERGRAAVPGLKMGVCGEHGGDPASIHLFHEVGLDYVSCSPYRVPAARFSLHLSASRPASVSTTSLGPIPPGRNRVG